jgi:hypothetical protein
MERFGRLVSLCSSRPCDGKAEVQEARNGARPRRQDTAVSDVLDAVSERVGWRTYLQAVQGNREVAFRDCVMLLARRIRTRIITLKSVS